MLSDHCELVGTVEEKRKMLLMAEKTLLIFVSWEEVASLS